MSGRHSKESVARSNRHVVETGMKRVYGLRSNYGVSLDEAKRLLSQNTCDGCGGLIKHDPPGTQGNRGNEYFSLDHDHKTKKVRGVLHQRCNRVLGFALDNPAILRKLADYLDNSS